MFILSCLNIYSTFCLHWHCFV